MKKTLSNFYKCPYDGSDLKFNICDEKSDVIFSGKLESQSGETFEIIEGVPDLTWPKKLAAIDKATRESYEKLAAEYDRFADIPFQTYKTSEYDVREKMTDQLELRHDSIVLEIGAGDGRGSEHIAGRLGKDGKLFVQELSPAFLKKAIDRLKKYEQKTNIEYSVANAVYLSFADNTFDAAHHFGGINTFSNVARCLYELTRVVKPGGKVVVGDESMAPWLRGTEFGKIMMNSNPLLKYNIPFAELPVDARDVKVEWIMMGAFFVLEFTVGEGIPEPDYYIPILSSRGGTHWTRYFGNLEGISDETKKLALKARDKSGKSMHQWLGDVVRNAANNELDIKRDDK